MGETRAAVGHAVDGSLPIDMAVFGWELNGEFVPREGGVHVGGVAVVVVGGENQSAAGQREGPHFLVRLVDVPVFGQVGIGEVQIEFNGRVAAVSAGELEGVVVEPVNADLPTCILRLVPEIGHHDAGPLAVADGGTDGADDLDLPRAVVERLRDAVVAPLPLAFRIVVEDGVEFVEFEVATDVGEPRHGDDVPVGRLHNAPFTESFLAGVGRNEGAALLVGQRGRNVGVPEVASVGGKDRVLTTDVEDLTVDIGRQVVLAAVATVRGVKHGPRGVGGLVGSQVNGDEGALNLVRLHVNALVGFEDGWRHLVGDGLAAVSKTSCQHHGEDHGQCEDGSAHAEPSLGRDLKPSLRIQGACCPVQTASSVSRRR